METKLKEILQYYVDNFNVSQEVMDEVFSELTANNVEVSGNSFFCPIYDEASGAYVLLAGTKDRADMWVLRKIIKMVRSGKRVYSMLNGNCDYILPQLEKLNCKVNKRDGDVAYIQFN